ncbi:MAG: glycosyltransferase family 2 protein [Proteobacteria bacterium]|nr:MAG: glycosyltransferase family 2 protein [Pseudomonadota bacterium]
MEKAQRDSTATHSAYQRSVASVGQAIVPEEGIASLLPENLSLVDQERKREPPVTVVIVNHNAGGYLQNCVASALPEVEELVVVDNASSDGSAEHLRNMFSHEPKLEMFLNKRNLGFAKACNFGSKFSTSPYVLYLNPDSEVTPGAIERMVEVMEQDPNVGMVGGYIEGPDGREQAGGRRAVPTPWRAFVRAFGLYRLGKRYPRLFSDFTLHLDPLPSHPIEVEAISGCCMLVRRQAIQNVGPLDDGYFLHCEDLDWCMRFREKGWKILFVPGARLIHWKGGSSDARPLFVEWHKHKGMMRFYRKFFRHQYPGPLIWLVFIGIWVRFTGIVVYHSSKYLIK